MWVGNHWNTERPLSWKCQRDRAVVSIHPASLVYYPLGNNYNIHTHTNIPVDIYKKALMYIHTYHLHSSITCLIPEMVRLEIEIHVHVTTMTKKISDSNSEYVFIPSRLILLWVEWCIKSYNGLHCNWRSFGDNKRRFLKVKMNQCQTTQYIHVNTLTIYEAVHMMMTTRLRQHWEWWQARRAAWSNGHGLVWRSGDHTLTDN